jgi:hypothetical protein
MQDDACMMHACMHHPRAFMPGLIILDDGTLLFKFDERSCTLAKPLGRMDGRMAVATRRLDTRASLEIGQDLTRRLGSS